MERTISESITLPCGLTLPNRLVKAATAEQLALKGDHQPNVRHVELYGKWAEGGWGLIIAGNVSVDARFLNSPHDVALSHDAGVDVAGRWRRWAQAANAHGSPVVLQLSHAGKQSAWDTQLKRFPIRTLAPSAVPLDTGDSAIQRALRSVIFGEAKAMTRSDIRELVQGFVGAARFAAECGFAGIELHAGYGHLLAQFLTSQHNRRADEYGGSARNRVRIVVEIVEAVRAILPNSFCIGIKLTSSDHKAAGQLEDCVEQMKCIEKAGIDFLEISGGSFEGPKPARGTFFQKFLTAMRQGLPTIRLIVTGGSRSRRGMEAALNEGACDMLGIGRPAILDPMLPKATILNLAVPDDTAVLRTDKIKPRRFEALSGLDKVGITAENAWYTQQMHQLAGPSRTKNQTFVETGDGITVASDADDG